MIRNLYDKKCVDIKINEQTETFEVNINTDEKYNEPGFDEFLQYFKSAWMYVNETTNIYYLFVNIKITSEENDLPLSAFIKLFQVVSELEPIFTNHVHACCILSKGSKKYQDAYNLLNIFCVDKKRRPVKFTESLDEMNRFFKSNRLLL